VNPGARRHDGFFLRMMLGPGYSSTSTEVGTTDLKFTGVGAGFDVAVGYSVIENFALYGQITGTSVDKPDVEAGTAKGKSDDRLTVSGIGAGAAYFIMPLNLYLHGGLLATTVSLESETTAGGTTMTARAESETGFGLNLGLGKEWWLSDNWGLGAGAQFLFSKVKDETDEAWTSVGFTVGVSATFN
jgi:hypothetical protein